MENTKFVAFDKYCTTCANKDVEESDPYKPCHDCLSVSAREYSTKPISYVKGEEKGASKHVRPQKGVQS